MSAFKWILLLFFSLLLVPGLSAQDTEIKDELTTVKIYLRLGYQDSACSASSDALKTRLEAVKGVWDVKILPIKKVAVFYMYSSQPISERKLRELVKQTGFILLKIDYSKEEPEEEKDGRSANILK